MLIWIRFCTKKYDTTGEISLTDTVTVHGGHFNKANDDIEMQTSLQQGETLSMGQGTLTRGLSREEKTATRRLYQVGLTNGERTVGFLKALYFYYTAPVTKFCYHTVSQSQRYIHLSSLCPLVCFNGEFAILKHESCCVIDSS